MNRKPVAFAAPQKPYRLTARRPHPMHPPEGPLAGFLARSALVRMASALGPRLPCSLCFASSLPSLCSWRSHGPRSTVSFNSPLTRSGFSVPRRICGGDDDCGEFAVDGGDQGEDQRRFGSENDDRGV